MLCNGGADRRGAPEKNLGPFLKMAGRRPARHVAGRRPSIVDCDRRQAGGLHDKWQGRRHIMTDGRPGACMTDDRPKACHDTRQAEGLHMTCDSHPRDLCQCLVRGALGGHSNSIQNPPTKLAGIYPCVVWLDHHDGGFRPGSHYLVQSPPSTAASLRCCYSPAVPP